MGAVVLATRNKGKIAELSALLQGRGLDVRGLGDYPEIGEIEETGTTFEANAELKARAVAQATGLVAVADDSGLEVDALDGAPGVYSARYSGENATDEGNNAKLLKVLENLPHEQRTARFRCVMLACAPSGEIFSASGAWEGHIATAPKGDQGFGYDPVFVDAESGLHSAQLTRGRKNARSHRGKALRALLDGWDDFMARAGLE